MTVVERLRLGRQRIEAGWIQGSYLAVKVKRHLFFKDETIHSYCAIGAISGAPTYGEFEAARDHLNKAAGEIRPGFHGALYFNDSPGTTKEQVIWMYDLAIANAEAEEQALQPKINWARGLIANLPALPETEKDTV